MLGTSIRLIAGAADTGGRYTVCEQVTPPGCGPSRAIHSREDEIIYILEGSYELYAGDERRTVTQAGDRQRSGQHAIGTAHLPARSGGH